MIRIGVVLGALLLVIGGIYSAVQQPERKETPAFNPKWKPFYVDPELLQPQRNESAAKASVSEKDIVITRAQKSMFPYVWSGYICSGNSALVVLKDITLNKEWVLQEGESIPETCVYRVKKVSNTSVVLTCENTHQDKELLYGKVLNEESKWRILFPDGQEFFMCKGDHISENKKQWVLVEKAGDPNSVSLKSEDDYHVSLPTTSESTSL